MNDSYLLNKYGISLAERVSIIAEQGGKCAVCGRLLDGSCRTEIDHEHCKVETCGSRRRGWTAVAVFKKFRLDPVFAKTKDSAIKLAKKVARRHSVRGILCGGRYAGCNRKIGRIDDPVWLRAVVAYLEDPPAQRVLNK